MTHQATGLTGLGMDKISLEQINDLRTFAEGLVALAELTPRTATIGQLTFFLNAALADLRGTPETFTDIRQALGPVIGKSLHTTYKLFLDRERVRSDSSTRPEGLGWLTREADPNDNRRKYLRLTTKGHEILAALGSARKAG